MSLGFFYPNSPQPLRHFCISQGWHLNNREYDIFLRGVDVRYRASQMPLIDPRFSIHSHRYKHSSLFHSYQLIICLCWFRNIDCSDGRGERERIYRSVHTVMLCKVYDSNILIYIKSMYSKLLYIRVVRFFSIAYWN